MQMWGGYRWRVMESRRQVALQTFLILSMFSKDVTVEMLMDQFGAVDPPDTDME
jgi:hypothetical protein